MRFGRYKNRDDRAKKERNYHSAKTYLPRQHRPYSYRHQQRGREDEC